MNLNVQSILDGYQNGYFLMADNEQPLAWYSSHKRALIPLDERFHISRSLQRKLRAGVSQFAINKNFTQVVEGCASRTETWISPQLKTIYNLLHAAGYAHSFESYSTSGQLAGGILGITLGTVFIGESMFHAVTDGSKAAMVGLVMHLRQNGFTLFDAQMLNPFLSTFGCYEVSETTFMQQFSKATRMSPPKPFTSLASGAYSVSAVAVSAPLLML